MKPHYLCQLCLACFLGTAATGGEVIYRMEGIFPFVGRSGPAPGVAENAPFSITFTVTNFTKTWPVFGNLSGDYSVSAASVSVPAFGLFEAPVANTNLELFLFDDGLREQLALNLVTEQTTAARVTSSMLIDQRGLNFIENPNLPSPLRLDVYNTPILTDAGWAAGVSLTDGSRVGVWTHGWPEYGYGNLINIPEPGVTAISVAGILLWSICRRSSLTRGGAIGGRPGRATGYWCSCGASKAQPFCYGSHKGSAFAPLKFDVAEPRTIAWCACKHTKNQPCCDGSHSSARES